MVIADEQQDLEGRGILYNAARVYRAQTTPWMYTTAKLPHHPRYNGNKGRPPRLTVITPSPSPPLADLSASSYDGNPRILVSGVTPPINPREATS
ncbi:hypothetical protein PAXINDRAFT_103350 [Paxillus involutus ATCC 200175]|uniref:Uncharacterized protein n=1 Tax=Paxillus involutus ATCC 200175 TaxID=664439 RepID=A0A0C9TE62_PAXIN|nr:hypothetical protein PAXINDRAFT_103350 [Paxillus involutus ATCC 200175]